MEIEFPTMPRLSPVFSTIQNRSNIFDYEHKNILDKYTTKLI